MSEAHKYHEEPPSFFNKALKVLAFPISLATGFWTMKINTSDSVYSRLKIDGGLDDLRDSLLKERRAMTQEAVSQIGTKGESAAVQHFLQESKATDGAYFKKIEGRLEELGLHSFPAQWEFIHRSQKQSAIINGLTITGITLGALLSVANSKALARFFADDDDKTPDAHPPQR